MDLFLQRAAVNIRRIINGFFAILLLASTCHAEMPIGKLNQNNDHGFWSEENIHVNLTKKWFFIHHTSQRLGDDYKRFWFFRQWAILNYDLSQALKNILCIHENSAFTNASIGLGFAKGWAIQKNTRDIPHWANTNRPGLVAFMTHKWKGWTLKQRMAFEYVSYVTDHYRSHGYYRHRAYLMTPWKFTKLNINPFISNEWFFRAETINDSKVVQAGPYHENRLRIGLRSELNECLETEFWWQYRTLKQTPENSPLWKKTYQFGLTINFFL